MRVPPRPAPGSAPRRASWRRASRVGVLIAAALALATVGSASPTSAASAPLDAPTTSPAATTLAIATTMNVAFTPSISCGIIGTCRLDMDIVRPTSGGPYPTIVLLQGGPASPNRNDYLLPFAQLLARRGSVVMVADWRQSRAYGGGYPNSFRDIACAIGVARAIAPRYRGRTAITLAGHSLGGWGAAVVALSYPIFMPASGTCDPIVGSVKPNALVDIDGAVDEPRGAEDGWAYVDAFFGGTRSQRPRAYAAGDPFSLLAAYPANGRHLPTLIVHGRSDTVVKPAIASWFHAAMAKAGYPNQLMWITGTHTSALTLSSVASAVVTLAR